MAYSTTSNSGHVAYSIREFVADTEADVADLPIDCTPGSKAFVIATSQWYMLNNVGVWVAVNITGGSSSGNIYDGGTVGSVSGGGQGV